MKLSKVLPTWVVDTVAVFLQDRLFQIHVGDKCSLPWGWVLSLSLFNVDINDLLSACSRKFVCADDMCVAAQGHTFEVEETQSRSG